MLKSYLGPFLLTFGISMFVFIMQFMWKYIDDLVGKGLSWWVIAKLLFYLSATLVPMTLPLAVLLSSIMTFGSFGEYYELTAVKSSGISLLRFMRPLIISVFLLSVGAFFFSNYVIPKANLKFGALLYDIRRQKPTLNIQEGIFNEDIEGVSIKVGKKDPDGKTLYKMIIYDHTQNNGNDNVILADKGQMLQTKNGLVLIMKLQKGVQYKEDLNIESASKNKMYITVFDKWERRFDLSQFALQRTNEIFFKDVSHMCNINQLEEKIDSVFTNIRKREDNMGENLQAYLLFTNPMVDTFASHAKPLNPITKNAYSSSGIDLMKGMSVDEKQDILEAAIGKARNIKSYTSAADRDIEYLSKDRYEFRVEYYRKFKLSVICLLFLFIGAPLGAIIRRGGLGWPFFFSILIFIVFYAFNIIGEKMAEEGSINIFIGAWLSVIIMIPIASFLTLKSNSDSVIFNSETYTKLLRRLFQAKAKAKA